MNRLIWIICTIFLFLVFSSVFYISTMQKQQQVNKLQIIQIEKRIALDLPLLDLSNELLKHSGNKAALLNYIQTLNTFIDSTGIEVVAITPQHEFDASLKTYTEFIRELNSNNGVVFIVFSLRQPYFTGDVVAIYGMLFILSILLTYLIKLAYIKKSDEKQVVHAESNTTESKPLTLIIDLKSKTLSSSVSLEHQVALANKPLCFYLALVEYCTNNPEIKLNHNKNVPEELIELANKYFYRLVELGHTVRKRPNFNNSLEKTLSEIRASLDDVLNDCPEQKGLYYPPKAFGEGSRSRMHSYGLANVGQGNIEIIGK
ncbi:membrane protein [Pseudoalteromonas issachenkonii]|uniref:Uncharacterized protein n=2 Tax=Pseudoalteromonas TaxID=53246 RepID=A0AB39AW65_9GAMM|nr:MULTISPECIES: hypothetical protein [Pseudoalteromonas]PHQ95571.1 MAG: hypothetical protein COB48_02415 [Pseudoalteromonas sp.]ALQ56671.1 membrane protein [Pseudoalteromonas issachenkonii]MDN3429434.1 hypothetical protein [Pseudoalteromonas sp. APC 3907]MDN3464345.1 hypothetical protein [Pseudoalteromonas sp. APC 3495]SFT58740.1 hypothetical protein SAMN04487870_0941 [Pseudoalteromonas sp. DSM 26666]